MRTKLAEIAGRSIIEEITERTLALEAALDASTSAPTDAGKGSETESGGSDEITALRSVVTTLRSELRMSRSVGLSATARIANLERENAALRSDLRSIYTNLRRSRTELSQLGTRTELERCLVQAVAMLDDMGVELSKALKDEGMVRTVAGRVVEAREVVKLQDAAATSVGAERAKISSKLAARGILLPPTPEEEAARIAATEEEAKEECAGEVVDEEAALIIAEEEESAPIAAVEEEVAPITAVKEEVAPGVYSDKIAALRSEVTALRSELRMSRSVGLSATARIANLERENAALRSDLRSIYTNLRRSRTELSQLGTRTELERCLVQAVAMLDDMGVELSKALKDEGMVRTVAGRVVEAREVVKLQDAAATSVGAERAKISSKLAARGILLPPTPEEEAARIAATEEEAKEECAGEVVDEEAALIIAEEEESAPIAAVEEEVAPIFAKGEEAARVAAEDEAIRTTAAEEKAARISAEEEEVARKAPAFDETTDLAMKVGIVQAARIAVAEDVAPAGPVDELDLIHAAPSSDEFENAEEEESVPIAAVEEEVAPISAKGEEAARVAAEDEAIRTTVAEEKAARISAEEEEVARKAPAFDETTDLAMKVGIVQAARIAVAEDVAPDGPVDELDLIHASPLPITGTSPRYAPGIAAEHVAAGIAAARKEAAPIAAAEEGAARMEAAEEKAGLMAVLAPSAAEEGAARIEAAEEKAGLMAVVAPSAAEAGAARMEAAEEKAGLMAVVAPSAAKEGAARMEAANKKPNVFRPLVPSTRRQQYYRLGSWVW